MGVISTQNITYRIVANGTQLDVFQDEDLQISNNITQLFDLGVLPSSFTRNITLPGSKTNNAFFQHMYDISIYNPYLFATNVKVPCYIDYNGIYLVNGYLQLNKCNVFENKAIDSYEVTIYGTLSDLARTTSNSFITDLTSLQSLNHTSSYQNITASWDGNLFNGDIVYPFADYGNDWQYVNGSAFLGINNSAGAVAVQNYKPGIRMKKVWDAIFDYAGYTYSSSFMAQSWIDDVYLLANNQLKYPIYNETNLETYGKIKLSPISGSGMTNVSLTQGTVSQLPWYNVEYDPQSFVGTNLSYTVNQFTKLTGTINLNVTVSGSVNNVPQFYLYFINTGSLATGSYQDLTTINDYYTQVFVNRTGAINLTSEVSQPFTTSEMSPGTYKIAIQWKKYDSGTAPTIILEKGSTCKSYITIDEVKQAADYRVLDVPSNLPFATTGIKMIDFIVGIQKKFNLVIYPDKTKQNQFIVETFNNWYNKGKVTSFDNFIDVKKPISVIPANNLAVNKLQFGDKVDTDYISQQFSKQANRDFGKSYYVDTANYFSQGQFAIETTFASAPLAYVEGTGVSGSVPGYTPPSNSYLWALGGIGYNYSNTGYACSGVYYYPTTVYTDATSPFGLVTFYTDAALTTPFDGGGKAYKFYRPGGGATYFAALIDSTGILSDTTFC